MWSHPVGAKPTEEEDRMGNPVVDAVKAVTKFEKSLGSKLLERNAEIRSLILALVARANLLLLGDPGTGKSLLANELVEATGMIGFSVLMGKTTHAEEVFGPLDLSGLTEKPSRVERVTKGFLPSAEIAFLDEIFKSSSAILNSLLTIINEKKFAQNGQMIPVPLQVLIGASNELPAEGLEALYDRFLFRHWVSPIRAQSNFKRLLLSDFDEVCELSMEDIEVLRTFADEVDCEPVFDTIWSLKIELSTKHGINISDRRWRAAMGAVRASAALRGDGTANLRDLMAIVPCLWRTVEEIDVVRGAIARVANPDYAKAIELAAAAAEIDRKLREKLPDLTKITLREAAQLGAAIDEIKKVLVEASTLDKSDPEVRTELDSIGRLAHSYNEASARALAGTRI
jgi:MoxR-like ATPase